MSDDVVTYADAAKWLPTDVREHIEATVPCFGGGEHEWQHQAFEIRTMDSTFTQTREWWSCARRGCNLTVNVEPKGSK